MAWSLAVGLVTVGCGIPAGPTSRAEQRDHERNEGERLHPPAKGPVKTVARGQVEGKRWRLTAYRSDEGLCIDLHLGSNSSGGCGFGGHRAPLAVNGTGWSSEFPHLAQLDGQVSLRVVSVRVRSGRSDPKDLALYRSKRFVRMFFVAFVPRTKRVAFIAYGRNQKVIDRLVLTPEQLDPNP